MQIHKSHAAAFSSGLVVCFILVISVSLFQRNKYIVIRKEGINGFIRSATEGGADNILALDNGNRVSFSLDKNRNLVGMSLSTKDASVSLTEREEKDVTAQWSLFLLVTKNGHTYAFRDKNMDGTWDSQFIDSKRMDSTPSPK